MNHQPSKVWAFAPFLAAGMLFVALYIKQAPFRAAVDERLPWVKTRMARFLEPSHPPSPLAVNSSPSTFSAPKAAAEPPAMEPQVETVPPVPESPALVAPEPVIPNASVDLETLPTDRSSWPQTVKLKRAVEFPAVVNSRVVGKVVAPAGSEANLVKMRAGNVGVEYRGGGAWVKFEDTDIIERVQSVRAGKQAAAH